MTNNPDNIDLNYIKSHVQTTSDIIEYTHNGEYVTFTFSNGDGWYFDIDIDITDVL